MHKRMRIRALILPVLLIAANAASAQLISFGVKGGVSLTDQTRHNKDESRPYTIGPSIEVRLPGHFAVEFSALYQRLGNSSAFRFNQDSINTSYIIRERSNSWEFPLLGKYYFRSDRDKWQPYLGTGYVFRIVPSEVDSYILNTDSTGTVSTSNNHYEYGTGLNIGATAAAGVRFRTGRFAILPEFRYTRWGGRNDYQIPRNDVKFLVGITF